MNTHNLLSAWSMEAYYVYLRRQYVIYMSRTLCCALENGARYVHGRSPI